eukprot:gb/GEZN01002794.1/.p1 GENE.gb/GEZN01002794.1/~~gb/GEZN01002794.1/.p1  ORF type:complete len:647 (-),score=125.45 gb/GEZN01002794.1/:418-2331(-)
MATSTAKDEQYLLHIRLVECRNLPAMDANGYSDPYVKFKIGKTKVKSKIKKKTLHPVYNEDFTMVVTAKDKGSMANLEVEVVDYDVVGSNDFIGYLSFPLKNLEQMRQLQGWFTLKHTKTGLPIPGAAVCLCLCVDTHDASRYKPQSEAFVELRSQILHRMQKAALGRDLEEQETKAGASRDLVKIWIGTWNVGNAVPSADLSSWMPQGGHDFYVVGAQECSYTARAQYPSCQADWQAQLQANIGPDYECVKMVSMWQIRLVVFAHVKHLPFIHRVEGSTEATGVGGVMGNKGGVALSFSLHDSAFCFVNSHLAAHQDKVKRRNADVREVLKGIKMGFKHKLDILNQYHHVFWMGDLNYRLDFKDQGDAKTPSQDLFDEMVGLVKEQKYSELFATDQLDRERKAQRVFVDFNEGPLRFPPTFKVQRDVELAYNEKRSPAWCDRILWKSLPGFDTHVKQLNYNSANKVVSSDHKPVSAVFQLACYHLPPATDNNRGACSLRITGLKAQNLPIGDKLSKSSDPYIVFTSIFSLVQGNKMKTPVKKRQLAPQWADDEIPLIRLTTNHTPRLVTSFLFCRVFDHNVGEANSLLCTGVLPLGPAISGNLVPFKIVLTSGGLPEGELEGNMQLSWEKTDFLAR